jgi:hypothetical protein
MLTKLSYAQLVATIRDELCVWSGEIFVTPRTTQKEGYRWITIDRDVDINSAVQLYFRNSDLYIRGFRVGSFGYRFRGAEGFMIAGGEVCELSYGETYRDLGWNRDRAIMITPENLESALANLRRSRAKEPARDSMLKVVIAFSEGVRFSDVVHNIYLGKPILPAMLDWRRRGDEPERLNVQVVKDVKSG